MWCEGRLLALEYANSTPEQGVNLIHSLNITFDINLNVRWTMRRTQAMAGESRTTTDHKEIQRWAEARGGRPATVRGTGGKNDAGLLRIDFNEPDDRLEEITWE